MKLKVFKMVSGQLEYKGIREVQQGDVILEGETSMAETVHTIQLRESKIDDLNAEILASLTGKDREDFEKGLRNLGLADPGAKKAHKELVESFLRMGLSQEKAEIAAKGR